MLKKRTKRDQQFIAAVKAHYKQAGRHHLPWRHTNDPYQVLISELMLQQTQVDRVVPKYESFIERWPSVAHLAGASLGDVLRAWQGLGYNRRAKFAHQAATYVTTELGGVFPDNEISLQKLPGVGPYTAAAVAAFAYNQRTVLIETNVRQAVIYHYFQGVEQVSDAEMYSIVERTLPIRNYREWYAAIMDYGSYLKRVHGNLARRSSQYTKQTPFEGSDRQIRGAIMKRLSSGGATKPQLLRLGSDRQRICTQLTALMEEGMVEKSGRLYRLP